MPTTIPIKTELNFLLENNFRKLFIKQLEYTRTTQLRLSFNEKSCLKWERPRALAGPLNLFAKAIGGTASAIMRRVSGRLFRYETLMLQNTRISQGERQDIPYHF